MKALRRSLALGAIALAMPLGAALAAPAHKPTHAVLHVVMPYKHRMPFKHVMASAKLRYTKGDVFIKITTDGLPNVHSLGKKAYVVFASDGAMTDRVGALKVAGNMAGVSGEVMMTKIKDLYIYAVGNRNAKHPQGHKIAAAML
ncbi:MAG: hypothetical protein ACRDFX_13340 [Chloroflexota bacterium]